MAVKHKCGIDSHAEPECTQLYGQGTSSVTHTCESGKMKMPVGWTSISDSILVFYSSIYMQSGQLQFITRLQEKFGP